jgi:GH15 family glucan-1,4-alpha-glucosidase
MSQASHTGHAVHRFPAPLSRGMWYAPSVFDMTLDPSRTPFDPQPPWRHRDTGRYAPISDYAVIGDMRTAALVGMHGSIDWCCWPEFDSPSAFAALLDADHGGRCRIAPSEPHTTEQRYLAATNVVVTTFHGDAGGVVEVVDFMPVTTLGTRGPYPEIHRRICGVRGQMSIAIQFAPRLNYAATRTRLIPRRDGVLATDDEDEVLTLAGPRDVWWTLSDDTATAELVLRAGEDAWFVLRYDDDEVHPIAEYESLRKFEETVAYWDQWVSRIRYRGPYRADVERSALVLKLMCYSPSGAIVAAPTTSLPESMGGVRNWDYRFTWLRDSAFVLDALSALGQFDEADSFMRFLRRITRKASDAHIQIMYGIDGRRDLTERSLPHLEGYQGSAPVRVGNGAYDQVQLDVYGEVLATAWRWSHVYPVGEGTWMSLSRLVDWVTTHWQLPDSGIWEVRAGVQHYVLSKVMCWVALEYGIRMAEEFQLPAALEKWRAAREAVRESILTRGWSDKKQSFVQYYGTDALDAANLVIPLVGFLPPDDPRVRSTVQAIMAELSSEDQELIFRYRNDDGLPGEEGVFSCCTFWAAQALAVCGDRDRAERLFLRMRRHANHVGLYSEELHPTTGEFLGNFPQAFTHIAMINCAAALAAVDAGMAAAGIVTEVSPATPATPATPAGPTASPTESSPDTVQPVPAF